MKTPKKNSWLNLTDAGKVREKILMGVTDKKSSVEAAIELLSMHAAEYPEELGVNDVGVAAANLAGDENMNHLLGMKTSKGAFTSLFQEAAKDLAQLTNGAINQLCIDSYNK